ncbi:hypothetical protein F5J12DRAFT_467271 [Pisolithus orientalis]|uniref:uncharacterized protein n=1 Tax=Pisolithus orientalis TaxID=936130 RepID=UPI002225245B|nr:uncharacterized protein F5J12DRAFT_467271 [Pisolithus orientalis]KAI5991283.1 hypothetical protein F5J12DRAFT_467271 [Pisolithus orientalis]
MSTSANPSALSSPAITAVRALLNQTLRVVTNDNRVFLGTFVGTDQLLNLLLVNSEEFLLGPRLSTGGRYVGQIVIPWRMVRQVGVLKECRRNECNGDGNLYM